MSLIASVDRQWLHSPQCLTLVPMKPLGGLTYMTVILTFRPPIEQFVQTLQ
jgi:hypothetical protein